MSFVGVPDGNYAALKRLIGAAPKRSQDVSSAFGYGLGLASLLPVRFPNTGKRKKRNKSVSFFWGA